MESVWIAADEPAHAALVGGDLEGVPQPDRLGQVRRRRIVQHGRQDPDHRRVIARRPRVVRLVHRLRQRVDHQVAQRVGHQLLGDDDDAVELVVVGDADVADRPVGHHRLDHQIALLDAELAAQYRQSRRLRHSASAMSPISA